MALFVRRRWPKVLAAVAVLAAVGLVVFLVTRDTSPDEGPSAFDDDIVVSASTVPEPSLDSASFSAVLSASDRTSYDGKQVQAAAVPVRSVVGPSAVWVGRSAASQVLVVAVSTSFGSVAAGDTLSFTGTVVLGTSEFGKALGLTGAGLAAFARDGAYVEVSAFETG